MSHHQLHPGRYIGRFAPSPTGPLHFGSLIAALASYLDARAHNGQWKVRIDDLDKPRTIPGASQNILTTLERFGFEWDDMVMYQSHRTQVYEEALQQLRTDGEVYDCGCSRKEIAEQGQSGPFGTIYPGTCRNGLPGGKQARALRCIAPKSPVCLNDRLQGEYCQNLSKDIGDFVIRRADGFIAYQLATVIDDDAQGVTDVVRGIDLLDSTPRQIHLQRLLGLTQPRYLHLPVAVNQHHEKLSKKTHARALDCDQATRQLTEAMRFLNQSPPRDLAWASVEEFWDWARSNWSSRMLPATREIVITGHSL
ncbi:MAG: tRNA glutamyl-Q(34) synthetase GluQRS [Gammaproteobacteria bacterium]|nr:tRNA glutamyl-Q(34) synthetase GluQRS [Gammaproteobacteria bacterium]